MVVTLRADNVLTVTLPSQKTWELDPIRGNTFEVKGENGRRIDFKRNADGKVTELSLNQTGSSTVYEKKD